ncbi:acyl-CoA thioesterase [Actinomadura parmotrematis]|uniref:Acyl-CoA thioesterase n=1 Tax=Actinomadura parmotrematis TaxID=2864039 RepID=A0ABS7FQY9_9ACTN|nr:acyl-CoA thioesterase [Actinomadura parmotrematis]MBW8482818.1 acyl-CoA thioesterase [Actinomadura parmotrematis]
MKGYEYRHVVGIEDTDLLGNVNYVNYVRWQGRAREMCMREYASDVAAGFADGVRLLTVSCRCEYLRELTLFDEVVVRMGLGEVGRTQLVMTFEYWRVLPEGEELVATGEQRVACVRPDAAGHQAPAPIPAAMRALMDAVTAGRR